MGQIPTSSSLMTRILTTYWQPPFRSMPCRSGFHAFRQNDSSFFLIAAFRAVLARRCSTSLPSHAICVLRRLASLNFPGMDELSLPHRAPAWEHGRYGHGLLTHFLLEALRGPPELV